MSMAINAGVDKDDEEEDDDDDNDKHSIETLDKSNCRPAYMYISPFRNIRPVNDALLLIKPIINQSRVIESDSGTLLHQSYR